MKNDFKKAPVTTGLIVMIVVVYVYTTLKYGIEMNAYQGIEAGGFNPILVLELKQYYRIITANFIHFGIMHIFCNAYSLYNLGMVMERILDRKKYVLLIVVSMLSTTLFSLVLYFLNGSGATSIMGGISGVIFGLIGSLSALAYLYKDVYMYLFKQIAPSVFLMLLLSFMLPSISLTGHIGGMIGGFLVTLFMEKMDHHQDHTIN
ncbi:MAG: rhomboid family intramembrane serine protease [Faecalibacillus sp.]